MAKKYVLNDRSVLSITDKMTGKMKNFASLNTSCNENNFCLKMSRDKENVCNKCYAIKLLKMYKQADKNFTDNYKILTSRILEKNEIPIIKNKVFRFSAFGEIGNNIHYANLVNFALHNPDTLFSLWTKRKEIVQRFKSKPDNLILIYSTPKLNSEKPVLPKKFDKVFTIYNKTFIEKKDITINCKKSCNECMICYSKNNIKYVNEKMR